VIASLIGVSLGYLVMFAIASQSVPPIAGDDRRGPMSSAGSSR
jgi:hypothetical protein